jgi:aminomuconate-semialdehyde/2-hydroxymuconate-6-semialdehyde dehydrogenase
MQEAGLPKGVVNMVFGNGPKAGQSLVGHPGVPLVSFTGGTATGRAIALQAAPHFKKLSLELGGKNANIIFNDADLDQALETTLRSSFLNQGEICLCGSRIYVQKKLN